MQKMWDGRFDKPSAKLLEEFNASITFDKKLYAEDIECSIAHANMLSKVGILTTQEADDISKAMSQIKKDIENGQFEFDIKDEDVHMSIEKKLTEMIGEAGKKLHTARSRNDQVAVDFRLYVQKQTLYIASLVKMLAKTILTVAKEHTTTIMPGMTHLQHAQPVSFAYHMLAYCSMLDRDTSRFEDAYRRNNFSPLGAAALAGTPHPIDRNMTSDELGFSGPTTNAMDSVSDRDFALDILFNISTLFVHLSRLSEEFILWSSYEFKWITISDEYATGSSIMPQKKNPDVPELIRGKSGRVFGNLMALLTVMKGLPLAYNKDMQEDKECVFDSIDTAVICLKIMNELIKTTAINSEKMRGACMIGHLTATDLADYLVKKGVPFRETHHISGRAVALAEKNGIDVSELTLEQLQQIDSRIESDAIDIIQHESSMNARTSLGGTSVKSVQEQIAKFEELLN